METGNLLEKSEIETSQFDPLYSKEQLVRGIG
jgi:hypothetical protein